MKMCLDGSRSWLLGLFALIAVIAGVGILGAEDAQAIRADSSGLERAATDVGDQALSPGDQVGKESVARARFCKCGCGARCTTSADCGGAACIAAITCCSQGDAGAGMWSAPLGGFDRESLAAKAGCGR
jgi:hypothetical protein